MYGIAFITDWKKTMESQTFKGLLKDHIFWAQDKDICDQCVRPWHDGICTCGHHNDKKIQGIKNIAMKLIQNGKNLSEL